VLSLCALWLALLFLPQSLQSYNRGNGGELIVYNQNISSPISLFLNYFGIFKNQIIKNLLTITNFIGEQMAKHKIFAAVMFMALIVLFISCTVENTGTDTDAKDNIFVLVNYKSQPGKHNEALAALNSLILDVKNEPNFVNIKLFADPSDETNILLYEQWSDEEYYKGEHMNTPHLQKFMGDSREFLAGPPDISFWKLNNDYTSD
jgi:quinol monooxygenase YgiN